WLHEVYDRLKIHGIVPYYYKKVPLGPLVIPDDGDSDDNSPKKPTFHLVPITPPIGAGEIYTYMDGKEQAYYWKWNNKITDPEATGLEDGSVYFIVRHEPTISGGLRCPIRALMNDHVYIALVTSLNYMVGRSLANPLHVIEYDPNLKDA